MQHAIEPEILHKGLTAADLGRDVDALHRLADDGVVLGWFQRCFTVQFAREGSVDQRPVGHGLRGIVLRDDDSIVHLQVRVRDVQQGRRPVDEDAACLGRRLLQDGSSDLDTHAAGGVALVRRQVSVTLDDRDPGEGHVQFLGRDLGEGGHDPGPQLHFADEDRHLAVMIDRQPESTRPWTSCVRIDSLV